MQWLLQSAHEIRQPLAAIALNSELLAFAVSEAAPDVNEARAAPQ